MSENEDWENALEPVEDLPGEDDASSYLDAVSKTLSEWDSPEDVVAWANL